MHTTIGIVPPYINGFNYGFVRLIIQFKINNLFAHSEFVIAI